MPFVKGISGNPGGRPKELIAAAREKHKDDIPTLIETAVKLGKGEEVKGFEGIKPRDRAMFLKEALDRLLGKAQQSIEITNDDTTAGAGADLSPLTPEEMRVLAKIDPDLAALADALSGGVPPDDGRPH